MTHLLCIDNFSSPFLITHDLKDHGERRDPYRRRSCRALGERSEGLLSQILYHGHGGIYIILVFVFQVRIMPSLSAHNDADSEDVIRPANKFKPNTRFLRNIIKGTDRHNKALLAKEQTEAQARLKDLADAEEEKRRRYRPSAGEIRGRQLGNITALLSGGAPKRKRPNPPEDGEGELSAMQKARAAEDARRLADMAAASQRAREKNKGKRRRSMERYSVRKGKDRADEEGDEYYDRRNSSSEEEQQAREDRKRRRKERSRSPKTSPRRHRHRSPLRDSTKDKHAKRPSDRSRERRSDDKEQQKRKRDVEDEEDSDPLDDLIGPKPPPKIRGRGALRGTSGMDSRFTPDYDPKTDVQPDDTVRDDWDESLEALRDRAKWKQQGADRLRQAGFTEDQIKRWEKGGEKTIDDVQWTKKGEGREWDRGKKVESEDDG